MLKRINISVFKEFFKSGSAGGFILISCLVLSLFIANSSFGTSFNNLLNLEIGYSNEIVALRYPIIIWINDGLMAVFFS